MVQLINIIGEDYVVWDKSAEIFFKRPAKENLFATFTYSQQELDEIKQQVKTEKEVEIIKTTELTNNAGTQVFCVVKKKIYIADKIFYKNKRKARALK